MKITTNYNYSNNFKSNKSNTMKVIKGKFFDGSDAIVQITRDNNVINNINAYHVKKNRVIEGMGIRKTDGLSADSVVKFFDKLTNMGVTGVNYFRELSVLLLK